jgi:hypothetical protein
LDHDKGIPPESASHLKLIRIFFFFGFFDKILKGDKWARQADGWMDGWGMGPFSPHSPIITKSRVPWPPSSNILNDYFFPNSKDKFEGRGNWWKVKEEEGRKFYYKKMNIVDDEKSVKNEIK